MVPQSFPPKYRFLFVRRSLAPGHTCPSSSAANPGMSARNKPLAEIDTSE
jgi:hypothetical protein